MYINDVEKLRTEKMPNQNTINWDRTYISNLVNKTDQIRIEVRDDSNALLFKDEGPISLFLVFGLRRSGRGTVRYLETVSFWQNAYEKDVERTSTWFNNKYNNYISKIDLPNEH